MEISKLKSNKGIAGLEILISLIASLFVAGVLVMAFTIAGSKMQESVDETVVTAFGNETQLTQVGTTARSTGFTEVSNSSFLVFNSTGEQILNAGVHYELVSGSGYLTFTQAGAELVNGTGNLVYNISGSYTWIGGAGDVINQTKTAISSVTDWFDTFIVIGAIVVLVLLIVLVIIAIRRAGLMGGGAGA